LRIASILTDFLYQKRHLSIPGIGKFFIDRAVEIPEPDDKNFTEFLQYIQFEQKTIQQHDEALIDFIRKETGKIKPLAEADLESYLSDCKLLLNIGKPFFFEGIGTLIKDKKGIYHFTPGAEVAEKIELENQTKATEKKTDQTSRPSKAKTQKPSSWINEIDPDVARKVLIGSGIAIGLILVIWGGIKLFNADSADEKQEIEIVNTPVTAPPVLPDSASVKNDTVVKQVSPAPLPKVQAPAPAPANTNGVKFVLQRTRSRKIAEGNYNKIKPDRQDLQIETKDSVTYKIYIVKKCTPADTTRIKQELNEWYWGKGEMRVYIEN
jgi:hypothetical protein